MKAFVYTELQLSVPFENAPWKEINKALLKQPGFMNKTWLAGVDNHSLGGIYSFETIEDAQAFVTGYFPAEARKFGAPQTTRIFDAEIVEEASNDMNSVHFAGVMPKEPGAYVYTEVQIAVPFGQAPWRDLNPVLRAQPGLLSKTWLSGLHTHTPGGIYAFDTIENARNFATDYFPTETAAMDAAYTTRLFDAVATRESSIELHSPFWSRISVAAE
jgi:hypothetical protein